MVANASHRPVDTQTNGIFRIATEIVQPAVRGTIGILESAHKFGRNIKRVVFTSSTTAVGYSVDEEAPMVRDEASSDVFAIPLDPVRYILIRRFPIWIDCVEHTGSRRDRSPWKECTPRKCVPRE